MLIKGPKLLPKQWKVLSSAFSNIGQATILFSGAAFFVPGVVSLSNNFPKIHALSFFIVGLILIGAAVIISKKED